MDFFSWAHFNEEDKEARLVSHRLSAVSSDYCSVCQNRLCPSAAATVSSPRWPLAVPFLMTYCQPASTKARLKCQHRMKKGAREVLGDKLCSVWVNTSWRGVRVGLLLLFLQAHEEGTKNKLVPEDTESCRLLCGSRHKTAQGRGCIAEVYIPRCFTHLALDSVLGDIFIWSPTHH